MKNGRTPWNNRRTPYNNWRNHGKIEEHHGKIEENMDKPMKTMDNSIKNNGKNPETSGKIDEQCEWEILATNCSKWEIYLAAKTKEGSLDDQKNAKKKHANFISSPNSIESVLQI